MLGKIEGRRKRGQATEDEMVGWHHQLHGHKFEQTPGDSEGWGSLVCCSPWDCRELDKAEQLNNNNTRTRNGWTEVRKINDGVVHQRRSVFSEGIRKMVLSSIFKKKFKRKKKKKLSEVFSEKRRDFP